MEIVTQIVIAILAVCIGVTIDLKIRKKLRHKMLIMRQDAVEGLEEDIKDSLQQYIKDHLGTPTVLGTPAKSDILLSCLKYLVMRDLIKDCPAKQAVIEIVKKYDHRA